MERRKFFASMVGLAVLPLVGKTVSESPQPRLRYIVGTAPVRFIYRESFSSQRALDELITDSYGDKVLKDRLLKITNG